MFEIIFQVLPSNLTLKSVKLVYICHHRWAEHAATRRLIWWDVNKNWEWRRLGERKFNGIRLLMLLTSWLKVSAGGCRRLIRLQQSLRMICLLMSDDELCSHCWIAQLHFLLNLGASSPPLVAPSYLYQTLLYSIKAKNNKIRTTSSWIRNLHKRLWCIHLHLRSLSPSSSWLLIVMSWAYRVTAVIKLDLQSGQTFSHPCPFVI